MKTLHSNVAATQDWSTKKLVSSRVEVPAFLAKFGKVPQRPNKGVNLWVCPVVDSLLARGYSSERIRRIVLQLTTGCGKARSLIEHDIVHALDTAQKNLGLGEGNNGKYERKYVRQPTWPDRDDTLVAEVLKEVGKFSLADLRSSSPVKVEGLTANAVLPQLFSPSSLVCCGLTKFHSVIFPVEAWAKSPRLREFQFIVPNPMLAQFCYDDQGKLLLDKADKPSVRLLCNTWERRFLVPEFDAGDFDEQAALICHLSQFGPLVMVVHSADKSLHAWFNCVGQSEGEIQNLFRYCCKLGADSSKWHRNGYNRFPGGFRPPEIKEGKRVEGGRQEIVFFNPERVSA